MCDEYNGWKNRETWALNLWLSNDEGLYNIVRERVGEAVGAYGRYAAEQDAQQRAGEYRIFDARAAVARRAGEMIKALVEELFDPYGELMAPETIITILSDVGSLYRVDWDEIGRHWLDDVTENPVEGDD